MLAIVAALGCEAKPMVKLFGLKPSSFSSPFPIYQNEGTYLIVSGIGKVNAGLAVAFLQAACGGKQMAWLNVGIAGHADLQIGSGIIAHKIKDQTTGKSYFPALIKSLPVPTYDICTVEKPETSFSDHAVYEMEASGFMQAALKFTTSELAQCYKVISDNRSASIKFKPAIASSLIETHCQNIILFANSLRDLCCLAETPMIDSKAFIDRWHFTATQKHQLERYLCRLATLQKQPASVQEFFDLPNADRVLHALNKKIHLLPLDI